MKRTLLIILGLLTLRSFDNPANAEGGDAEMNTSLRIAVCQIRCVDGDLESNLARVESAAKQAAAKGAVIACFPETTLLGWVNPEAHERADPIPGPTSKRLQRIAIQHRIMLAVGLAEKSGTDLHDSAVLIDRDGTLLLTHRKVNILTELMNPPYTPGPVKQSNVVATRHGRIGMLVCADTFRDDVVAAVTEQQPDLLIVPYGWAAPPDQWPEHGKQLTAWVTHTAKRAGCAVVGTDLVGTITHGPWTGQTYGGQSVVNDREGKTLVILADRQEEVRVVEVAVGRDH